jgi:hypothetical protein
LFVPLVTKVVPAVETSLASVTVADRLVVAKLMFPVLAIVPPVNVKFAAVPETPLTLIARGATEPLTVTVP